MKHEPNTDEPSPRANVASGATPAKRKWSLRLAAISLACLPFAALEIGLRTFAPSPTAIEGIDNDPYVDLHQLRPLFALDETTNRWAIEPSRYNFFRPASFPAEKSLLTRRIFVLGGSTVQGRPYSTETAFSTWLQLRLKAANPKMDYEVINCGGVSYASYRVAKILAEVLQHQPDAIVIYTGHNEFLEDRTYAEVREASLLKKWANKIGSNLRTVTWLRSKFADEIPKATLAAEVDAKLDHVDGLESYQRDPTWRHSVQQHFTTKLNQMVDAVREANIPLILCVPASDWVDTPPIKIQTRTDLSEQQHTQFESAWSIASDDEADTGKRIVAAKQCLELDPDHAGARYILGRQLFQQAKSPLARPHLTAARDHDVCPLRATTPIIDAVRLAGDASDVWLVDTESLLDTRGPSDQSIPDGIPDPDRFVDHLHPTIAAHQKIAHAISDRLMQLDEKTASPEAEMVYQRLAEMHLNTLDESYYARGKQRLEGLHRWATGRAKELGTQDKIP